MNGFTLVLFAREIMKYPNTSVPVGKKELRKDTDNLSIVNYKEGYEKYVNTIIKINVSTF